MLRIRIYDIVSDTAATAAHMRTLEVPGDTLSRYATRVCEAFRRGDVTVDGADGSSSTVKISMNYGDAVHTYMLSDCSSSTAVVDFVETLARNAADAALFREQRDTAVREVARWVQQQQQQQQQRQQRPSGGDWRTLPHAGSRGIAAARQRKAKAMMARMTGGQMDPNRALLHPSAAKRARPTGAKIVTQTDSKEKDDDEDDDDLL